MVITGYHMATGENDGGNRDGKPISVLAHLRRCVFLWSSFAANSVNFGPIVVKLYVFSQ